MVVFWNPACNISEMCFKINIINEKIGNPITKYMGKQNAGKRAVAMYDKIKIHKYF